MPTPTEAARLRKQMQRTPSVVLDDPDYRRLRYVRYADDFLLGFIGPRDEAEAIKRRIGEFLRDQLKLELSETKTLITHARTEHARFLGYDIGTLQQDERRGQARSLQREGRAEGARGSRAGAMQVLLAPWKADPPPGTRPRLGVLHRGAVPAGVSGLRGVLQAGDEPELPPRSPEVGHGDGLDQDAGA